VVGVLGKGEAPQAGRKGEILGTRRRERRSEISLPGELLSKEEREGGVKKRKMV